MAPPRSQSVKPTIIKARALYAFQANSSNELSLKVGDLIDVVERGPSGGWSKGVHGAFPTDYVEFISGDKVMEAIFSTLVPQKEKETQSKQKADVISSAFDGLEVLSTTFTTSSTAVMSSSSSSSSSVQSSSNLSNDHAPASTSSHHPVKPSKPKSVSTTALTPQTAGGSRASISSASASASSSSTTTVATSGGGKKEPVFAIVKYSREAGGPTELSIKEGETVLVIKQDSEWWYGSSLDAQGKSGYFPGNYVELKVMIPPAPSYSVAPIPNQESGSSSSNSSRASLATKAIPMRNVNNLQYSTGSSSSAFAYNTGKYGYQEEAKGNQINWNELCSGGLDGSRHLFYVDPASMERVPVWQLPLFADMFADVYKHKLTDEDTQLKLSAVKRIGFAADILERALSYVPIEEQFASPLMQTAVQRVTGMLKDAKDFCSQMPLSSEDNVRCFAFIIGFTARMRGLRAGDSIMIPSSWISDQTNNEQAVILIITRENENEDDCFSMAIVNSSNINDHGLNYHSFAVDPTYGHVIRNLTIEVNRLPKQRVLNTNFW